VTPSFGAEQLTRSRFQVQRVPRPVVGVASVFLRPIVPIPAALLALAAGTAAHGDRIADAGESAGYLERIGFAIAVVHVKGFSTATPVGS
jgi:hypothetical protein